MNNGARQSSTSLRLALLLAGLALINLANYDEDEPPRCNCSGYRMTLPGYLLLSEGETSTALAEFPRPITVQWSIERMPSPDVVASLSVISEGQRSLLLEITAADRFDRSTREFFLHGGPVETRRTEIEIRAVPDDPAFLPENRCLLVLGRLPRFRLSSYATTVAEDSDLRTFTSASVDSEELWAFDFDVSDAPSVQAPLVQRDGPADVTAFFPVADVLTWEPYTTPRPGRSYALCEISEPIHVTASRGDRVFRGTAMAYIHGATVTGVCPQPSDFRD